MAKSFNMTGKVVLVAANDPMVNILIEDILREKGCTMCGPHLRYDDAFDAAESAEFHLGIFHATLQGKKIYPVADLLDKRSIPYLIVSGDPEITRLERPGCLVLGKPFVSDDVLKAMETAILRHVTSARQTVSWPQAAKALDVTQAEELRLLKEALPLAEKRASEALRDSFDPRAIKRAQSKARTIKKRITDVEGGRAPNP
jgi:hypothetical protein